MDIIEYRKIKHLGVIIANLRCTGCDNTIEVRGNDDEYFYSKIYTHPKEFICGNCGKSTVIKFTPEGLKVWR